MIQFAKIYLTIRWFSVDNFTLDFLACKRCCRTFSFRVTLRDNNPGGGCTTERDITVTVTANAGPVVVTQPDTAVTWAGNSTQTVTWNVAGTTGNGVNCSGVNMLISTDGGATFSTLVAGTPNDGSQAVTIPNVGTTRRVS